MQKVGTVKEIWRYPVKGMAGERLDAGSLGSKGIQGDRCWAVRDRARNEIQSCKVRPALLRCTARYRKGGVSGTDPVDIRFPDGSTVGSDDPDIHARLTALTGHGSRLEPLEPNADLDTFKRYRPDGHSWLEELKATFEREPGEPLPDFSRLPQSVIDYIAVPGTFFLVAPFHLVTTATLSHLENINPQSDWDRRRFRPNVVIETNPGEDGLVEQSWIGRRLLFGTVGIDCVQSTPRCGAITREQPDLGPDKAILRTVVRDADQNVGVYGRIRETGELWVGDSIYLV